LLIDEKSCPLQAGELFYVKARKLGNIKRVVIVFLERNLREFHFIQMEETAWTTLTYVKVRNSDYL